MSKFKLTTEQIHELWDVDVEEGTIKHRFNKANARIGDDATSLTNDGYLRVSKRINGKKYIWLAHQIIWVAAGNDWPGRYEVIHHKNEDKISNGIDNLILMSFTNHNRYHFNKPEDLRHIYWHSIKQNWNIQIVIDHKSRYFGSYKDLEDAKTARDEILQLLASEQENNDG